MTDNDDPFDPATGSPRQCGIAQYHVANEGVEAARRPRTATGRRPSPVTPLLAELIASLENAVDVDTHISALRMLATQLLLAADQLQARETVDFHLSLDLH